MIVIKETLKEDTSIGAWTVYHDDIPILNEPFNKISNIFSTKKGEAFMKAYEFAQDYIVKLNPVNIEL